MRYYGPNAVGHGCGTCGGDPVESRDLVYDAFLSAPPQRWLYDGYARVDALEALLDGGGTLPYEQTFKVLEPVFANFRQERWNDQIHGWRLRHSRYCCLPKSCFRCVRDSNRLCQRSF